MEDPVEQLNYYPKTHDNEFYEKITKKKESIRLSTKMTIMKISK